MQNSNKPHHLSRSFFDIVNNYAGDLQAAITKAAATERVRALRIRIGGAVHLSGERASFSNAAFRFQETAGNAIGWYSHRGQYKPSWAH